jgi:hypothetical protein
MALATVSPVEIRQIVTEARRRRHIRAVAVSAAPEWPGDLRVTVGDDHVLVVPCSSPLAARQALNEHEHEFVVLLTDCAETELGDDVMADLCQNRLVHPDRWAAVRGLFRASRLDAALTQNRHRWLPDALCAWAPPAGYPPTPTGVLDVDTAHAALAATVLGTPVESLDLAALAEWASSGDLAATYTHTAPATRDGLRAWISERLGAVSGRILDLVVSDRGADVVPAGLVADLLYGPDRTGTTEAERVTEATARALLGRHLGNGDLSDADGVALAGAARQLVDGVATAGDDRRATTWIARAGELATSVQAHALVERSNLLPEGFERRVDRVSALLADALDQVTALDAPAESDTRSLAGLLRDIERAASAVRQHRRRQQRPERVAVLDMAVRMVRRLLTTPAPAPAPSLVVAAERYAADGAFVDWARTVLTEGDSGSPPLAEVCRRLSERCREDRETENRRFAELLRDWTATGSTAPTILPIERVLDVVVAPLAATRPVLVLVLDGLSQAVFRELIDDVRSDGWIEQRSTGEDEAGRLRRAPVLAMLPTVTDVSRASLLCGRAATGGREIEIDGFRAHSSLRAANGGRAPTLLHKIDVSAQGGHSIDPAARAMIADPAARIVGAVVNSIDDHLTRGDQVRVHWGLTSIRPLAALLDACREADRLIVLTSDHGHVLGRSIAQRTPADPGGERWRPASSPPRDDEVEVAGTRVLRGDGRIVVPWTERLRYSVPKAGYHGGVTPQETLVPLTVLTAGDVDLPDWQPIPAEVPAWWEPGPLTPPTTTDVKRIDRTVPPVTAATMAEQPPDPWGPTSTTRLSGDESRAPLVPSSSTIPEVASPTAATAWLDELLASDLWAQQRRRAGRTPLDDARARQLLELLDQAGSVSSLAPLAQRTGIPELRMRGTVTALRRLVNVEGYDVVALEPDGTVRLDRTMLTVQFGLEDRQS